MKNNLKLNLEAYLRSTGKPKNWIKVYNQFPYRGTDLSNRQKSDSVRGLYKRLKDYREKLTPNSDSILDEYTVNQTPQIITTAKEDGLYIILGCVHAPFVNKAFWKAMLKLVESHKDGIKGLILNGDFLDLNSLSSHDRGKLPLPGINLGWEYSQSKTYLDSIENLLNPNIYKGYIYGNHEERFNRYMASPDFKKLEGAVPNPIEGLDLVARGYDIYTDWKEDEIQLGDLSIMHGEFFNVHICKKYLDVFKKNILMAHSHRAQVYKEGEHAAYNIGCMLDWNAPVFNYATRAMKKTWSNSFSVATLYKGKTSVELVNWMPTTESFSYGGDIYTKDKIIYLS